MGEMPDWSFHVLGIYFMRALTSVRVLLGLCALLLFLVSWLLVLSWADYSWAGILLVTLGVAVICAA